MNERIGEVHATEQLWPSYALRAWLGALLSQIRRVHAGVEKRIDLHERIIARLREKLERSHSVIRALEESLERVDGALRNVRDSEILEAHERAAAAARESRPSPDPKGEAPGHEPEAARNERTPRRPGR